MNNNRLRILAVIPARGGSKGIPRKNVRLMVGKPLMLWYQQMMMKLNVLV
jgi:CMP-N-acetylneuraminic acid synthetase